MRLFIAIEVPDEIRAYAVSLAEPLKDSPGSINWVKKENMHLTLKFLGEVDDDSTGKITEALKEIKFEDFEANTAELGAFPSMDYIRVLWLGIEPHDKINALQQQLEQVLQPLAFKKDNKFHPHLTLARVKFLKEKQQFTDKIKQIQVEKKQFSVKKIKLIKSILTKQGPIYRTMFEFNLSI